MVHEALFSSEKMDWRTPPLLFERLNQEFNFTIDLTASKENTLCPRYYTEEQDALKQDWNNERAFLNPPYGRAISKFISKAYLTQISEKNLNGCIVCLIPSRTDVEYFHKYCMKASEIRFIEGRLKFSGSKSPAPFPSCLVIFKKHNNSIPLISSYPRN